MKIPFSFLTLIALVLTSCEPAVEQASDQDTAPIEGKSEVVVVSAEEVRKLLEGDDSVVVLDVRTPAEFAEGHIEGAMNLDFESDQFSDGAAKLDPNVPYLLHCRSGFRSGQSLPILEDLAIKKIYHLDTGFNGWEKAGLPIEK